MKEYKEVLNIVLLTVLIGAFGVYCTIFFFESVAAWARWCHGFFGG